MAKQLCRFVPVVTLCLLLSCQKATQEPLSSANDGGSKGRAEGDLTVEEVKKYLDGKTLELPSADPVAKEGKPGRTCTIKKESITALRVGNGFSVNNERWQHEITFIYDTGDGLYSVIAQVEHRLVGDQQAFFGFKVVRIAKQ